jgi:putative tryptophan/tyrosine transport system substrate-binding protein
LILSSDKPSHKSHKHEEHYTHDLNLGYLAPPLLLLADQGVGGCARNGRKRIALFAMAERMPTMFGFRESVEYGCLMSYGTDLRESWRRTASFGHKILKGTKPGDLPIEFPTKVELLINLIAAKALGINVPPTLLARADEVIE